MRLVGAASSSVAIQPRHELSAVRHDIGLARRRRMGHSADARRGAEPFDPIEEAAQRPGMCGRAVSSALPAGRTLGSALPKACPVREDGRGFATSMVFATTSMICGTRSGGALAASQTLSDVVSRAVLPRSTRCRSAVASVSRPARVRRVASSMSLCLSFTYGAF